MRRPHMGDSFHIQAFQKMYETKFNPKISQVKELAIYLYSHYTENWCKQ